MWQVRKSLLAKMYYPKRVKKADIRIWNITQCDSCGACIKVCRRKALEIEVSL